MKIKLNKAQSIELLDHMIAAEVYGNVKLDKDGIEVEDRMVPHVIGLLEAWIKSYPNVLNSPEWMRRVRRALKASVEIFGLTAGN